MRVSKFGATPRTVGAKTAVLVLGLALSLGAGCAPQPQARAPTKLDLSHEIKTRAPKINDSGACWQNDIRPAVIETVTRQVEISPAQTAPSGAVIQPARYSSESHQRILRERHAIWFQTPCDWQMTAEFIGSVQRALKARGLYKGAITGAMSPATQSALQSFQSAHGLDSPHLALATAHAFGLLPATDWERGALDAPTNLADAGAVLSAHTPVENRPEPDLTPKPGL